MTKLSYNEMGKLTPCRVYGSRRYWFDGEVWQCLNCVESATEYMNTDLCGEIRHRKIQEDSS